MTYSFTNGTTASGTEVNTNFQDVIDATSDGTLDFNISALTCAGVATFNGNVLLGNASGDDVQFNGSLATSIPIKTTRTYDIGSADLGLRIIYLGMNSTYTIAFCAPSSGASADYTLTLPATVGVKGQALLNGGSATMAWAPKQYDTKVVTDDNYTILDDDGYETILVTTSGTDRTITLPTVADNANRRIVIKKADSGAGKVIIDPESTETIDGSSNSKYLNFINETYTIKANAAGTAWFLESVYRPSTWTAYTPTFGGWTTPTSVSFYFRRNGHCIDIRGVFTADSGASTEAQAGLPTNVTIGSEISGTEICGTYFNNVTTDTKQGGVVTMTAAQTYLRFGHYGLWSTSGINPGAAVANGSVTENGDSNSMTAYGIPVDGWDS